MQGINKSAFNQASAILKDTIFRLKFDRNKKEDLEKLKLLNARTENLEFELELAQMICGDNKKFLYRSSYFITKFFQDLGLKYEHDGTTRRFWVRDVLLELSIHEITYIIKNGLFRKKDFKEKEKQDFNNHQKLFNAAVNEFKEFIKDSVNINEEFDLSYVLDLNINIELLYDKEIKTNDNELNLLIQEAKERFLNPNDKHIAIEKLWDAFERMKTYYSKNKKQSGNKLVELISKNFEKEFFEEEFKRLTTIGNDYRIRHHETNKKEVNQVKHLNYLFFRMLSLIDLCLTSINENNHK